MPFPPSDGGAQAMHNTTLGLLDAGVDVDVLAVNPSRFLVDQSTIPESYKRATNFKSVEIDTRIKALDAVVNLFTTKSYFVERFRSKEFDSKIKEVLLAKSYDIIQLEHLYLFLFIKTIREISSAKVVFRPQNVEYVIWDRFLKNIKNPLKKWFISLANKRLRRFEEDMSKEADAIMALTPQDASAFSEITQIPSVDIPMGFDLNKIERNESVDSKVEPVAFYHLGTMDWLPNEEAIRWFIREVYPEVKKELPDAKVYLAGRGMPEDMMTTAEPNLIVKGNVTDPIIYQQDKQVMVVPLLSGSGIRAKIVEGLALGKTVISTTIGAQGIDYTPEMNLLLADTPDEFASQMSRCYHDRSFCDEVGRQAKILANDKYHSQRVTERMLEFYSSLLGAN